jgi:polysaccharide export outer membrane protein
MRILLLAGFLFATPLVAQETAPAAAPVPPPSAAAIVSGTTSMDVLDNTRKLGAGDRLSYRVVEERREPVGIYVGDGGEVEVPLVGRVPATGRTCRQLAASIKSLLERDYFHNATVIIGLDAVSGKARGRVYITGQVRAQGPIDIPPDERLTLSKAIVKAGGFADFANKKKVKLIRRGPTGAPQTQIIDVDAITSRGELDKDPELQPDDTVIVPEKFINF